MEPQAVLLAFFPLLLLYPGFQAKQMADPSLKRSPLIPLLFVSYVVG